MERLKLFFGVLFFFTSIISCNKDESLLLIGNELTDLKSDKTAISKGHIHDCFAHGTHVFVSPIINKRTGAIDYKNNPEKLQYLGITKQNCWGWASKILPTGTPIPPTIYNLFMWNSPVNENMGQVAISNDEQNVYFKFSLNSGYYFIYTEYAEVDPISVRVVGDFGIVYSAKNINELINETGDPTPSYCTLTIPRASIPVDYGNTLSLNIIGTVLKEGQTPNEYKFAYAKTSFDAITSGFWQWTVPYNTSNLSIIPEKIELPLYADAELNNITKAKQVGKAIITFDGTTLKVNYEMNLLCYRSLYCVNIYSSDTKPTVLKYYTFTESYKNATKVVDKFSKTFIVDDIAGDGIWLILNAKLW